MTASADPKPQPPEKPLPNDCCGGGCTVCVNDVYQDELELHARRLREWRARQAADAPRDET